MKTRLATLLVALATLCGLQAQAAADGALYVYRTDGRFTVFAQSDVDSITYSRYDAQGQLHDSWQMQLVHTRGSVTAIPLSVIDSVSLATPQAGTKGIDYVEQPAADVQGAGTAASPYMTVSAAPLGVSLQAECHYTDARGLLHTYSPQATLSLTARRAMAVAADAEALGTQIQTADGTLTTEGTTPAVYTYRQTLATSGAEGQQFDVELRYEAYTAADGTALPYLQLSEPRLVGIEVKERSATRLTTMVYDTVRYDVTARFEVDVEAVNTTDALSQTLTLAMHYEGGVVNAQEVEVELVKTEYRKEMLYHAPHDNISSTSQCVVYRDNYYSDGSVKTDEFYGLRWDFLPRAVYVSTRGTLVEGEAGGNAVYAQDNDLFYKVTYHMKDVGDYGTYISVASTEIYGEGVPELNDLSVIWDGALDWTTIEAQNTVPSDLGMYGSEAGDGSMYDASNPADGFYVYPVDNSVDNFIEYKKNGSWTTLFSLRLLLNWYDRFFSIDGQVIGFEEYRPVVRDTQNALTYEEVPATATRGPARVYTLEAKGEYLSKEIHLMLVDTVYVTKGAKPTEKVKVVANAATDVSAGKAVLSCTLPDGEDVPLEDVSFYVYSMGEYVGRYVATSKSDDGVYSALVKCLVPNSTFEYKAAVYGDKYYGSSNVLTLTTPEKYTEDDAVDLGLSVLWATYHNVGAKNEGDGGTALNSSVSSVNLGEEWSDGWRVPTKEEWEELREKCTWETTNALMYGRAGYIVTGPNGNQMCLFMDVSATFYRGYYLTSTPYKKEEYWGRMFLAETFCDFVNYEGVAGSHIRLVRDK